MALEKSFQGLSKHNWNYS
ncbi:hypothetical protein MTR67_047266 [Solanum verrucosum]|uniref:Uncharacterized protein n=1 Tax=Solanum verrucosum TaxID=315347 RepID=A0AAF0ZWD0_SOLVR|nr:hypothetical protein MTR67_047266 [Solanum verrucosum]